MNGKLSLVATPIGNMEDITLRAIKTLINCDYIVCEDTRHTDLLLKYHNIKNIDNTNKKLLIFHANSSGKEIDMIMDCLHNKKHLCYVSDAGTPTISDPGVLLVNKVYSYNEINQDKIILESLPGACAFVTAYSLSGASGNNFTFCGFMPHKKGRETLIKKILTDDKTSIVYESVHRIEKLLDQFLKFETDLNINKKYSISRELTKMYEDTISGDINYCINFFKNNSNKIRGEFVVVII
jgi:16S rRNA (cytidine1402-2'-O)-methyltransferase